MEDPDQDDLCPICHLLLCKPVTTPCRHTVCLACMQQWSQISSSSNLIIIPLDTPLPTAVTDASALPLEATCPMCRASTHATPDAARATALRQKYPQLYASRVLEDSNHTGDIRGTVEYMTVHIGNRHEIITADAGSENQRRWTFFVQASRPELVQEVHVVIHPTFRPSHVSIRRPPYELRRVGWGTFTVVAFVSLVQGYKWQDADMAGRDRGIVRLEWMLDFDGDGSQGRCRLKLLKLPEEMWTGETGLTIVEGEEVESGEYDETDEEDESDEEDDGAEDDEEYDDDDDDDDDYEAGGGD